MADVEVEGIPIVIDTVEPTYELESETTRELPVEDEARATIEPTIKDVASEDAVVTEEPVAETEPEVQSRDELDPKETDAGLEAGGEEAAQVEEYRVADSGEGTEANLAAKGAEADQTGEPETATDAGYTEEKYE